MRSGVVRELIGLSAACGLFTLTAAAFGAWPPPPSATPVELKDKSNWPDDPEYGFDVAARKNGQWVFYSFIPDRPATAPPLHAGEVASGMSIDLAWRHTIGSDRIVIAVLDSGIRWREPDLLQKAWLNRGELSPP